MVNKVLKLAALVAFLFLVSKASWAEGEGNPFLGQFGNTSYDHGDFDTILKGLVLKGEVVIEAIEDMNPRLGTRIRPAATMAKGYDINYVLYTLASRYFDQYITANKFYISDLSRVDPTTLSQTEQLAYWLNLRNSLVIDLIFENLPIKRKEMKSLIEGEQWQTPRATINGKALSIEDIENIITTGWEDPRVIYGLYYGTFDSPFLGNEAFSGKNLNALLERNAKNYLNASATLKLSRGGELTIPFIFEKHQNLYQGDLTTLMAHFALYLDENTSSKFHKNPPKTLSFKAVWKVNDLPHEYFGTGENKLFVYGSGIGCTGIETSEGCDAGAIPEQNAFHAHLVSMQRNRGRR